MMRLFFVQCTDRRAMPVFHFVQAFDEHDAESLVRHDNPDEPIVAVVELTRGEAPCVLHTLSMASGRRTLAVSAHTEMLAELTEIDDAIRSLGSLNAELRDRVIVVGEAIP